MATKIIGSSHLSDLDHLAEHLETKIIRSYQLGGDLVPEMISDHLEKRIYLVTKIIGSSRIGVTGSDCLVALSHPHATVTDLRFALHLTLERRELGDFILEPPRLKKKTDSPPFIVLNCFFSTFVKQIKLKSLVGVGIGLKNAVSILPFISFLSLLVASTDQIEIQPSLHSQINS